MHLHLRLKGQHDLRGQIYEQLKRGILEGRFTARDRMPASRELARQLRVSRNAVAAAYELQPAPARAGLHIAAWLSPPIESAELVAAARELDIGLYPLSRFGQMKSGRQALVFGYGALDEQAIGLAVQHLKKLFESF